MAKHMRQTTRAENTLPCALHGVEICVAEHVATLHTFFIFLLFLTSLHLFIIANNYFTSNNSVWCCKMSLLMIFHRNVILIILTTFSLNASLAKFRFPTLCTFCWIASHILMNKYYSNEYILDSSSRNLGKCLISQ